MAHTGYRNEQIEVQVNPVFLLVLEVSPARIFWVQGGSRGVFFSFLGEVETRMVLSTQAQS